MKKLAAIGILSATLCASAGATDWSAADYDLYPGDFDGDGKTDMLYVAKDVSKASGIARSDGSGPNEPYQTWPSNAFGIPWHSQIYKIIVEDFNGDERSDLLLQRQTPGDHFLLLTGPNGKVIGISQTISNSALGQTWSGDKHKIHAGDFNGDNRADVFLQAATPSESNAVVYADSSGYFTSGPTQTWTDATWGAFKWSAKNSNIFVGDFNGDGRADLLVQAKPNIVMIDYEIPIPVPTYSPNSNGIALSQGGATPFAQIGVQSWSRNANGVDWSPTAANIIVGDFDNNGRADVLLQARNSTRTSYLLSGNSSGSVFTTASALAGNVTWAGDSYRLVAGNFDGSVGAGVYYQALTSAGTNYYANTITGGSVSQTTHTPSAATGVVAATAVGHTVGSFSVSDSGSANYSIPVVVPPGVAGLQPALSINYASGGGNGPLGIGWGLGGFSEISRCAKTLVQDNSTDGVLLSMSDRFCLDGNKLRITGGTYGASGSTYQTELETFARVTAQGSAGNGPAYFVVEAKDGLIYEYGNTADSRIESLSPTASTTPRTWALNKVTDRHGNYMTITYQEDGAPNGSFRPTVIYYTANSNTGLAAAYRVLIQWESRPSSEKVEGYLAGGVIRETQRLNAIETQYNEPSVGWRKVRKYDVSYNNSGVGGQSRLAAIQECDRNENCLSPTTIGWQEGTFGWNSSEVTSSALPSNVGGGLTLDMNGDGRADYVYFDPSTNYWRVRFGNSDGTFQAAVNAFGGGTNVLSTAMPADVNGDGRMDLLVPNTTDLKWWWVRHTSGSSFTYSTTSLAIDTPGVQGTFMADVNGDGLSDYVYADAASVYVRQNTSSMSTASFAASFSHWTVPDSWNTIWNTAFGTTADLNKAQFQPLDLDADGRDDLLVRVRVDRCMGDPDCHLAKLYEWRVLRSTGTALVAAGMVHSAETIQTRPMPADVNSDGVTDLVYAAGAANNQQNNTWRYRLGMAGGSIVGAEQLTGVSLQGTSGDITDCDLDGRSDVVFTSTASEPQCLRSNGAGLVSPPISLPTSPGHTVADVNGDGLLDFITSDSSSLRVRLHRGVLPDFVASITDGFGNTVSITYAPLTDPSIYTPGTGASFPEVDVQGPMYVVKQYTASDGVGGSYSVSETYGQARAHARGRGFLGFRTRSSVDSRTGVKSTATYRQDHPYVGFTEKVSTYQPGGVTLISEVTNTPAYLATSTTQFNERGLPYTQQSVQKTYEVAGPSNGLQITQVTTTTTLDSYGNPTNVTTTTADSTGSGLVYTSSTTNVYATADADCWWRGFVTNRTVTNIVPGAASQTRTAQYVKDTASPLACRVQQEIVEPNDNSVKVTTTLTYDDYGHPVSQALSAANIETRTTSTTYAPTFVMPTSVTQSVTSTFSHTASKTYDFALGVPLTATDPNGLVVEYKYDGFGRLTEEKRPDQTKTTFTYSACTASNGYCGDSRLRYQVEKRELDTSGGVIRTSRQHFDAFSRALYSQTQTLSGAFTNVATNYDNLGRAYQQSQPYFTGFAPTFTTVSFDLLGRPTSEQRRVSDADASTQSTQYTYNRLISAITDANNKTTTKEVNAIGQVIKMTDAASGLTRYEYDAFGNLTKTIDPANNQIVNTFNIRGFKTSTNDPDMGSWGYTYYPTGELWTQTDAKSQVVTFTYDRISRPKTRVEPEGTTTFNYGESATASSKTRGKLVSVFAPGSFSESFAYDGLGRLADATTNADATPFVVSNSYSATTGFLETVTYPTSTSAVPGSRFKVKYEYEYGLLKRTRDFNTPATIYWEQVATNAAGQAIDEQFGNGLHTYSTYDSMTGLLGSRTAGATSQIQNLSYLWDKVGNLTQRRDQNQNLTENFFYDNLYRLDYSQLNGVTNLDLAYNSIGNITSKSGMTYSYPSSGVSSVRPHAVSAAGANSYSYDSNGNMTTRNGSSITWYSYNLPNRIDQGANYSQFFYGADRARYKQVAHVATGPLPAGTETTIYVGGLYERVTKPSGTIEHKHYILAGKEPIAIRTIRDMPNPVHDTRYLHKDHLGSVDVVTNESGAVVERFSYDAFGKRRSATAWSGAPGASTWTSVAAMTHRGFTFHEQLDNVGLIHMNGRVYDPDIGRFISADPFIQAPLMSQSLNRYSYVMNNPLSLIDPSGYSWLSKGLRSIGKFFKKYWREIVAVVVAVVITIATGGTAAGFWGAVAKGAVAGATYGATITALYGGNFGQILEGALTGALVGGAAAGIGYGFGQLFAPPPSALATDFGFSRMAQVAADQAGVNAALTGITPEAMSAITAAMATIRGRRFATEEGAALALHRALTPVAIRFNIEIGAKIWERAGRFGSTFVVGEAVTSGHAGTITGLDNWTSSSTLPREAALSVPSAEWHAHPGYSSDFSAKWTNGRPADIERYVSGKFNGYVSLGPRDTVLKFDRDGFEQKSLTVTDGNTAPYKCVVHGSHGVYGAC